MKQINLNHQQLHSILINDKFVFVDILSGVEVDLRHDGNDNEYYFHYCNEFLDNICTPEVYYQTEGRLNISDNFIELVVNLPESNIPESKIRLSVSKLTTESDFSDYISI